jgi:hypothetical protein
MTYWRDSGELIMKDEIINSDDTLAQAFYDQLRFRTTIQLLADANQILDGYEVPDFDHLVDSDRERLYLRAIYLAAYYYNTEQRKTSP